MKTSELSWPQRAGDDAEAVIREARRRQRRRQFVTGVVVVLALAGAVGAYAAVGGNAGTRTSGPAGGSGPQLAAGPAAVSIDTPGGPPRYYATEEEWRILIRSAATGAVTATVPNPYAGHDSLGLFAASVAVGGGGREFVAAYTGAPPHSHTGQTRLYAFHLTRAGHVTGLSLVKGGVISGLGAGTVMAVSPDGSQVALTAYPPSGIGTALSPAEIVVINLRTGVRGVWEGGLQRPGYTFSIPSMSWGASGHFLVFLSQWCRNAVEGGFCAAGPHDAQVRTLRLAAGGGRLSQGSALLGDSARYPDIVQALLSSGGKALTLVVLRGPHLGKISPIPQDLRVIRVPLGHGGPPRMLYHGVVGHHVAVFLGSDDTGRYLLLGGGANGWIDHGALRLLAPQGGYAFVDAW